jgi:dipeptidyl aminopeptidase/acylaminoacyl peptidase
MDCMRLLSVAPGTSITHRTPIRAACVARLAVGLAALAVASAAPPAVAGPTPPAPPAPAVTLEQLLGAPRAVEIAAAPTGRALAWIVSRQGASNVWVADGEPLRARPLTSDAVDDGQEAEDLAWTPDGRAVVFARGATPFRNSESVLNPTSDVAGSDLGVWIAPLDGSKPRRLGVGRWPVVSPRGDRVVFIRDGQPWVAPVTGTATAQPLFQAAGKIAELTWAPDGSALAFVSRRGNYNFIGVFHLDRRSIEYVSPAVDRDQTPRWSPDGLQIAFLRVENAGGSARGRFPNGGSPWGIMVARRASNDADFGPAREAWRAPQRAGGSYPRLFRLVLEWVAGNRLVFASEHEDWVHLYVVDAAGTRAPAALLTPGPCEIDQAVPSVDRRTVFFMSNCGDPDRRHVWKVALPMTGTTASPAPQRVTAGTSIETNPEPAGNGASLFFLKSDGRTPPLPWVASATDGTSAAVAADLVPASFPSRQLVEPKSVVVTAADGLQVHCVLFEPPEVGTSAVAKRRPAIIQVHSGPNHEHEMLGWGWSHDYDMNQYLASQGYVVLAVNMRGGVGFGRAFREVPNGGANGASEYQDVLAGVQYLRGRADVDPARIGSYGISFGGYLTQQALARNSDLFAAGVAHSGIYDWSTRLTGEAAKVAREAAPISSIDKWRSPILIIHGDADSNVEFGQTISLVQALRARGIPYELLIVPDEGHFFATYAHLLRERRATADFFERMLKKPATHP